MSKLRKTTLPPAYTPGTGHQLGCADTVGDSGDEYSILKDVESVVVLDDSGSMGEGFYGPDDVGRMEEMSKAVEAIAPILASHDPTGIEVYFMNNKASNLANVKSPGSIDGKVKAIRPFGTTPTGRTLKQILDTYWGDYIQKPAMKPINIVIITDGQASDKNKLLEAIYESMWNICIHDTVHYQVSLFFFQVGNPDTLKGLPGYEDYKKAAEEATKFLKSLDDDLKPGFLSWAEKRVAKMDHAKDAANVTKITRMINDIHGLPQSKGLGLYDIVDTTKLEDLDGKTLNAQGIKKVVLGGLKKSLDSQNLGLYD